MGGRGSWSAGSKGEIDVGDAKELAGNIGANIIGPEETRGDIKRMSDMAGLKDVDGTGDIPTAILGAQMIQLQNLEREFNALKTGNVEMLSTPAGQGGTVAAVAYQPFTGAQTLMLNSDYFKNAGQMLANQLANEHSGWNMPTNGTVKEAARYAITHEYGHMLHNELYNRAKANGYTGTRKQFVSQEWLKIQKIANERYGASKSDLSRYGNENRREAFAEAFANSQLGRPTKVGLAMRDYLRDNRL